MPEDSSRSHASLHRNEDHLRLLVDAVTEYAIYTLDPEGRVATWNTGAQRIKGYKADEILGQSFTRFFPDEARAAGKPEALLKLARETGQARDEGWRIRKDGSRFFAEAVISPIFDQGGELRGYAKVTRDITDRRAMEDLRAAAERLAENERRLRVLTDELQRSRNQLDIILNGVDSAITAQDRSGKLIFANAAAASQMGYTHPEALMNAPAGEVLGKVPFLDEDGRPFPAERLPSRLALRGKTAEPVILRYRLAADAEERWSLVKASPVLDAHGHVAMAINFSQDITALKLKELEERAAKEQLRVILESISDAIAVQDGGGRLLYLNRAYATLLGFDSPEAAMRTAADPRKVETLRKGLQILDEGGNPFPPEENPARLALKGAVPAPVTLRVRMTAKGKELTVISAARPIFDAEGKVAMVISVLHDVTELREAELKLRQSQKMEAVGRLAGGIAHDFNNLLTAINGYSDLALAKIASGDRTLAEDISEIRRAGERAASLTQQLLAFSRKQILSPKILDLNEVLASMDALLQRLIGENIELLTICPPGLGKIKADPGQIEQIILNLAINARDAMPEGGKLTLETAEADLDPSYVSTHLEFRPGRHIMLAVTDTGVGMDAHTRARIFEPFFTTKATGKGTGLGLSTVFGIVKQSGGNINVYSEPGKGTTFKIYFPVTDGIHAASADPAPAVPARAIPPGGTVLIVEDEEGVRKLVERTLAAEGYHCLSAHDGETALGLLQEHAGRIDLLITDVILPGINGKVLAGRAEAICPGIRVLYMSGYTENAIVHHGVLDEGTKFINKPFSAQTLKHRVLEVLGQPG